MINEEYKAMLGGKSVIRELSEYATSRGAEIGYQNVFDYSLGNPSVPAPKSFTDAMVDLYENGDPVAIHGYSPSLGIPSVKDAIAENLNERFGMAYTGNHIFPTTGAAGAGDDKRQSNRSPHGGVQWREGTFGNMHDKPPPLK